MTESRPLYPDKELPDPALFRRPPITRRTAQFFVDIPAADFDRLLPAWIESAAASGSFERKVREHWDLRVLFGDGPPRPKATLTQIPQLRSSDGGKLIIEAAPAHGSQSASLRVVQARSDENPTRFVEFQSECRQWLNSFLSHFGLDAVGSLLLEYRNEITAARYPEYWPTRTAVKISLLLHVFDKMPNPPNPSFQEPFELSFTRSIPENAGRTLGVRIMPASGPTGLAWVAILTYAAKGGIIGSGEEGAANELVVGHGFIYEEFCNQFTEEALELFRK